MIANYKFPKNWSYFFYLAKTLSHNYNFYAVSLKMGKETAKLNNVSLLTKTEALKKNFDIGILLSRSEGFPNVLIEYSTTWNCVVCHDNHGDALNYFIPEINSLSVDDLFLDKNELDFKISNLITKLPLKSNFKTISEIL